VQPLDGTLTMRRTVCLPGYCGVAWEGGVWGLGVRRPVQAARA